MPSSFEVRFDRKSLLGLLKKLHSLDRAGVIGALQKGGEAALKELLDTRPPYPPERPGQRYQRTQALGQSLSRMAGQAPGAISRVQVNGNEVRTTYGTSISYAKWVVYQATQAWMHRGRWWTVEAHFKGHKDDMLGAYRKEIERIVNGKD